VATSANGGGGELAKRKPSHDGKLILFSSKWRRRRGMRMAWYFVACGVAWCAGCLWRRNIIWPIMA